VEGGGSVFVGLLQRRGGDKGLSSRCLCVRSFSLLSFPISLLLIFFLLLFILVLFLFFIVIYHLKLLEVILEGADGMRLLRAPQGKSVLLAVV
jgi:hypothetical protein